MRELNAHINPKPENGPRPRRRYPYNRTQWVISEEDKDISEVEHAGDAEDIPQDQAVGEAITVGVITVTRRILHWIISQVVLRKEQHVMRAEK